jgi:hypothetical protein
VPTIKLTKSAIDSLPVTVKETVYWDAGLPGFGVKVTPKGKRVFIVLYRTGGAGSRLRKYTIGPMAGSPSPWRGLKRRRFLWRVSKAGTRPLKKQTHDAVWSSIAWMDLLKRSSLSGSLACGPALPLPIGSAMTSSRGGALKASTTLSGETSSIL